MANVIQQKFGTLAPAASALAKGELAIRFVAANHTAASSSKLYFGEGDTPTLRQFGFGITDGSTQSGVAIGENLTFTGGNAISTSVSGNAVTINHDDTSSQASVNNSGSTFIQDITLDTYGHVTAITSASAGSGSGDIEGVTAGDGLTGGGSSGSVTLNVVGGDGITANANDIAVTAANTNLTSIINDSFTKLGRNATQEYITFATDNEINTFINNTERLSVTASGVDITGALTVSGSYNLASGDIPNNAADTSGNAATATALATARTIAGVSFDGTSNISLNNNAITNGAGYTTNTGTVDTTGTVNANEFAQFSDSNTLQALTAAEMRSALNVADGATANTGDITGVTAGTGLSGGGSSGAVTLNVEATQTINTLNSTGFLLDSSGDITLDAAGEDIIFKDAGSERVRFNIGNGCETDITGDYHLDSSGSVKIDAATDITLEAAGDDIIFTDGGVERFRFNLDGTPDMVGTGDTAYRASGELTLDTDAGIINFNDAGVTRISFDISDASPEMDVTGNFTIDGSGTIELDGTGGVKMTEAGDSTSTVTLRPTTIGGNNFMMSSGNVTYYRGSSDGVTVNRSSGTSDNVMFLPIGTHANMASADDGEHYLHAPCNGKVLAVILTSNNNLIRDDGNNWFSQIQILEGTGSGANVFGGSVDSGDTRVDGGGGMTEIQGVAYENGEYQEAIYSFATNGSFALTAGKKYAFVFRQSHMGGVSGTTNSSRTHTINATYIIAWDEVTSGSSLGGWSGY